MYNLLHLLLLMKNSHLHGNMYYTYSALWSPVLRFCSHLIESLSPFSCWPLSLDFHVITPLFFPPPLGSLAVFCTVLQIFPQLSIPSAYRGLLYLYFQLSVFFWAIFSIFIWKSYQHRILLMTFNTEYYSLLSPILYHALSPVFSF